MTDLSAGLLTEARTTEEPVAPDASAADPEEAPAAADPSREPPGPAAGTDDHSGATSSLLGPADFTPAAERDPAQVARDVEGGGSPNLEMRIPVERDSAQVACEVGGDPPDLEMQLPAERAASDLRESSTEVGRRNCVVCLSEEIETVSLPCRHSTMCSTCLAEVLNRSASCPVCRARIRSYRVGHFDSDFVDLAPVMLEAPSQYVEALGQHLYGNIYYRIKLWLFLGTVASVGAVVSCIFFQTKLAVILGSVAFVVGYVPWIVCTISMMEEEPDAEADAPSGFVRLIRNTTCSRPFEAVLRVLILLLSLALIGPFVLVLFLFPYFLYAMIYKRCLPFLFRGVSRVLIHGCLALWQCLDACVCGIRSCVTACFCCVYQYVFAPIGQCVAACTVACCACAICTCHAIAASISRSAAAVYAGVLVPIAGCLATIATAVYVHTIAPAGRCCAASARATTRATAATVQAAARATTAAGLGIASCCRSFHAYTIAPIARGFVLCARSLGHCVCTVMSSIGRGVVGTFTAAYTYVISPIGRGFVACASSISSGIASLAGAIYLYVVSPVAYCFGVCVTTIWHCLCRCFSEIGHGIAASCLAIYTYVLSPIGRCFTVCVSAIGTGLCTLIRSVGSCLAACFSAVGRCISVACMAVYTYILAPVGRGFAACVAAIGNGIFFACVAVYSHVLAPTGRLFAACALAIGRCVRTCAGAVITAVGACISSIARCVTGAATSTYTHVVSPILDAIASGAGAVRRALLSSAAAVRRAAGACARGIAGLFR